MKYSLFLATLIVGFIPTPSFSIIILDDVMNKETQQETGVSKFNLKQKQALERWLNATFVLKSEPVAKTQELFLSINIDSGHQIQLSDGSVWDIDPTDVEKSSVWLTPFPVRIVPSHNTAYPQLLINGVTGVSVKARPAQSIKQTSPSTQPSTETPPQTQTPKQPSTPQTTTPAPAKQ